MEIENNINKIKTESGVMIRKKIYPIDYVFQKLGNSIYSDRKTFIDFDGEQIKANSQRYIVFKEKGCVCATCGLQATYFALERHIDTERFHLNLYGVDEYGKERLFTKDHIHPKSKGGVSEIDNYQTMCIVCNEKKKDDVKDK